MFSSPKPLQLAKLLTSSREGNLMYANEQLSKIVGRVDVIRKDGSSTHGSCFLFSSSFRMLTCAHVVSEASSLVVILQDISVPARVLCFHELLDIALIQLDENIVGHCHELPFLKFAPQILSISVDIGRIDDFMLLVDL